MSDKIRVSEIVMEVVTSDVNADPVMVKLDDTGVKLSVGDSKIKFSEDDLEEVITVLERVRQLAGDRPAKTAQAPSDLSDRVDAEAGRPPFGSGV